MKTNISPRITFALCLIALLAACRPATAPSIPAAVPSAPARTASMIAYVQDDGLYMQTLSLASAPVHVDDCPVGVCIWHYLKWSPGGESLLYYRWERREDGEKSEIRLADAQGRVSVLAREAAGVRPAAWSPDGRTIAFLRLGDAVIEYEGESPGILYELWTVEPDGSGETLVGKFAMPDGGCGGGGRSASAELYEREEGTAYGYWMSRLEWTAQQILLYSLDCTAVGVGRYDMEAAAPLAPYTEPLRGLVLNAARDRWVAVAVDQSQFPGGHRLVTGDPAATTVETIPTTEPVELVFQGENSGQIYFTTRELTEMASPDDGSGIGYSFYTSALWSISPNGSGEQRLYEGDDHALAGLVEASDGSLIFVRIENDRALLAAVEDETVAPESLGDYQPRREIVRLTPGWEAVEPLIPDAGLPALN